MVTGSIQSGNVVGVFWDYRTCPPPADIPVYEVVEWLHQIAMPYGSIIRLNTYMDMWSDAQESLISDLQYAGVSLVHCPATASPEATCRSMMVDLFTFALDYPVPSFVVITQSTSITPCLAALKRRQHHILLATPASSPAVLRAQGSRVLTLNWRSISEAHLAYATGRSPAIHDAASESSLDTVETCRESLGSNSPLHFNVTCSDSHLGGELDEADEMDSHKVDVNTSPEIVHGLPTDDSDEGVQSLSTLPSLVEADFPKSPVIGCAVPASPTTVYASNIHLTHVDDVPEGAANEDRGGSSSELLAAIEQRSDVGLATDDAQSLLGDCFGLGVMLARVADTQRPVLVENSTMQGLDKANSTEAAAAEPESSTRQPPLEADPARQATSMVAQQQPPRVASPISPPSSLQASARMPSPGIPSFPSIGSSFGAPHNAEFQLLIDVLREFTEKGQPTPRRGQVSEVMRKRDTAAFIKAGCAVAKSYAKFLNQAAAAGVVINGTEGKKTRRWVKLQPRYLAPGTRYTPSGVAPVSPFDTQESTTPSEKFKVLIEVLQQLAREGILHPIRSTLSTPLLERNPDLYKKAGVPKFRTYVKQAKAAGVVTFAGAGVQTSVTLDPRYA